MSGAALETVAVMRLVDMISGPLRHIRGGVAATDHSARSLGQRMGSLAAAMAPIAVVSGVVVGGLAAAATATIATSKALGELSSVGVRDMAAMESAAESFSNKWAGTTKADFIGAAYDIKSGISSLTDTGIAEFTRLAALTGKATKSTTAEMTSLFATGYGIYKGFYNDLTDLQFGEMFSAGIAAAVQQFKTTGSGMSQAISQLGATATTAQVPLGEQLAVLGMLQSTMSGSEAGTKYKAMMQSAAGAGEKLGISFLDSNNKLMAMPGILNTLKAKYGDTLDEIEKQQIGKAFGTKEAVAVIDLLYDKTGQLTDNIAVMGSSMGQGSNFVAAMANTMNNDLGATLEITGQRLHNLLEIVGKVFVPVIMLAGKVLGVITLLLQKLAASTVGSVILTIAGVTGGAVLAFVAFAAASIAVSAAMPVLNTQLGVMAGLLGAVTWPVWLVVGAVAALYLAFKFNLGGIGDYITGFFGKARMVFAGVRSLLSSLSGGVGHLSTALATKLEAAGLLGLVTTVTRVVVRVKSFLSELWGSFKFVSSGVANVFAPVLSSITQAFAPISTIIKSVTGLLLGGAAATSVGPWKLLGRVVGVTLGAAFKIFAYVVRLAFLPLQAICLVIGTVVGSVVWLGRAIGDVVGFIVVSFTKISGAASYVLGVIRRIIGDIGASFASAFTDILAVVSSGVRYVGAALVSGLKWAFLNLTPAGWLRQAFSEVGNINLFSLGAHIWHSFTEGLKSKIMAPVNLIKESLGKIRNLLPFSDAKEGPLSSLTLSGRKVLDTLGTGIRAATPLLKKTFAGAVGAALAVTPVVASPNMPEMALPAVTPVVASPNMPEMALPEVTPVVASPSMPEMTVPEVTPVVASPGIVETGHALSLPVVDAKEAAVRPRSYARAGKQDNGSGSAKRVNIKKTEIIISNITLPGVQQPQDFVQALQDLVASHDVYGGSDNV